MKILELQINNIRGLKYVSLIPGGESFVIWGPNGSGKSGVVDAIDFLLTGSISRLVGEGTHGVTLAKHGPHIDHVDDPNDAYVKAIVSVPGVDNTINLHRCIASPDTLDVVGADIAQLSEVLTLAASKQHSLSRKEILKYVVARASTRSEEIQALLNLEQLEESRKVIQRVFNDAKKSVKGSKQLLVDSANGINRTLSLGKFSVEAMTGKVNELRALLGGDALEEIELESIQQGIAAPAAPGGQSATNPEIIAKQYEAFEAVRKAEAVNVAKADEALRKDIKEVNSNLDTLRDYQKLQLLNDGVLLLDDSGECPLCGTKWDPEELRKSLHGRIESANAVANKAEEIDQNSSVVLAATRNAKQYIETFAAAAMALSLDGQESVLNACIVNFDLVIDACGDPLNNYLGTDIPPDELSSFFLPAEFDAIAQEIVSEAKKAMPTVSPEQTAYDTLTRFVESFRQYLSANNRYQNSKRTHARAKLLSESFASARETELEKLYSSIEGRFSGLYKAIHGTDEENFTAKLDPDGKFEVEFYGRGLHPPLALHSEGHQDSMGVCLYLALAERLTEGMFNLTVLDDVVMSVDSSHRRDICAMFKAEFSDRQFLITTHDKTWARQLLTEGVVTRGNSIEFTRWSLEGGPSLGADDDLWGRINDDMSKHNVPDAAFHLRNGSECFFEHICDALKAKVKYKLSGTYDLSDYMFGAVGRYNELLKAAKTSASSWGNTETVDSLKEQATIASQIFTRTNYEQWMVNAAVHFNSWHEFSETDFLPIVEAFRDCFDLFSCTKCGSLIRVSEEKGADTSVRCACQRINWNLVKKT